MELWWLNVDSGLIRFFWIVPQIIVFSIPFFAYGDPCGFCAEINITALCIFPTRVSKHS